VTTQALCQHLLAEVDRELSFARSAWLAVPTPSQRAAAMVVLNALLDYRLVLMAARQNLLTR
jgi:hypothetical protein